MSGPRIAREREPLGFMSVTGSVLAAVTVIGVLAWTRVVGPGMFSPGALNASVVGKPLGGVTAHAQLAEDCEACHSMPFSSGTMGTRCVRCHSDVAMQLRTGKGLHARIAGAATAPSCTSCHTEHRGPTAALSFFDHKEVNFELTGAHTTVACDGCHARASTGNFEDAPRECVGCHKKNDPHRGAFGTACDQCHNTRTWDDAKFDHKAFPINHGREERKSTCKTCHPKDVSSYDCLSGCHAHTPQNIVGEHEGGTVASLRNCIRCHKGGRSAED